MSLCVESCPTTPGVVEGGCLGPNLDDDAIEGYRVKAEAAGRGYQTLMSEILRAALAEDDRPVTAKMLRKILREELHAP